MNSQTIAILFATLLVVAATLIPTYIISKRSATSEDDWAVADRSLPIYVVIGTFMLLSAHSLPVLWAAVFW